MRIAYICTMYNDFNDMSPEDKVNKYNSINGITEGTNGYVDYIPNDRPSISGGVPNLDLPKVSLSTLAPVGANITPLLSKPTTTPSKTSATKPEVKPATIVDDPQDMKYPFVNNKQTLSSLKATPNEAARQAYSYYVNQKSLSPHVAAAIVGNLYQESGVDPTRKQNGGGPGRGVAQWTVDGRWAGYQKWAGQNGRNPDDLHSQLDYILVEPGQEKAIHNTMNSPDVDTATMAFGRGFEAPKESAADWGRRTQIARYLLNYTK